jgi:aminotransferase
VNRVVPPRPERLERLPRQYFAALLGRVAAAAGGEGPALLDLGRGNPEKGPPDHVVARLAEAADDPSAHGYPPFRGLGELKEAIASRYASHYDVSIDPEREVVVVPGTKSALVELMLVLADRGKTVLLPDPGYPDYHSGAALAGADVVPLPLDPDAQWLPDFGAVGAKDVAALYLNYPSNPCAAAPREEAFAEAVAFAEATGAALVHDFAYGDIVFDGIEPLSLLSTPGAREVGVEMFSMSKTYGMAGWRIGFVVGNAEIVSRLELFQDHVRAGVFAPIQHASIAALTGPQESVAERVAAYDRRRRHLLDALASTPAEQVTSEATFFVWFKLPPGVDTDALLETHRIALAPGQGFGARGAGWARASLAVTDEVLEEGAERLARGLRGEPLLA